MLVFAREVPEGAGFLDKDKGGRLLSYSLPVETIRSNLAEFLLELDAILPEQEEKKHGFGLDSFQVAVSINGKGQVGFLGTGGELGGSATLTLSFKRG